MTARDFLFDIELSGPVPSRETLRDLTCHAFEHAGCSSTQLPATVDELQLALAGCASSGGNVSCGLRFHAHAGELEIDLVSSGGSRIWHASRRMG